MVFLRMAIRQKSWIKIFQGDRQTSLAQRLICPGVFGKSQIAAYNMHQKALILSGLDLAGLENLLDHILEHG